MIRARGRGASPGGVRVRLRADGIVTVPWGVYSLRSRSIYIYPPSTIENGGWWLSRYGLGIRLYTPSRTVNLTSSPRRPSCWSVRGSAARRALGRAPPRLPVLPHVVPNAASFPAGGTRMPIAPDRPTPRAT